MKRTKLWQGMILVMLIGIIFSVSACENVANHEGTVTKTLKALEDAAPAADPFTGGWASIIAAGLYGIATTAFGINRSILAKRRGKAIIEINDHPESPPAVKQVVSKEAARIIQDTLNKV